MKHDDWIGHDSKSLPLTRYRGSSGRLGACIIACFLAMLCTGLLHGQGNPVVVTDFSVQGSIGFLSLRKNQEFQVRITSVPRGCYIFNRTKAKLDPDRTARAVSPAPVDVVLSFHHDGRSTRYIVEATRRKIAACDSKAGPESLKWEIEVETLGWKLGFAGAFTLDSLTSDQFFLQPLGASNDQPQFNVMVSEESKDDLNLGAAAMIHLYHNSNFAKGMWAPVSFGLGVDSGSEARYYVGTSLRFNTSLFLTGGAVFGSVETLPVGIRPGMTTTDANLLSNLGSRTEAGFFFSLSYSFGNINEAFFSRRFNNESPTDATAQ